MKNCFQYESSIALRVKLNGFETSQYGCSIILDWSRTLNKCEFHFKRNCTFRICRLPDLKHVVLISNEHKPLVFFLLTLFRWKFDLWQKNFKRFFWQIFLQIHRKILKCELFTEVPYYFLNSHHQQATKKWERSAAFKTNCSLTIPSTFNSHLCV